VPSEGEEGGRPYTQLGAEEVKAPSSPAQREPPALAAS